MFIHKLRLQNYRNYESQEIQFTPGVNIFIGENAQGKTNALEAIYVLALGKSHRTSKDSELIRWGHATANMQANVTLGSREYSLSLDLSNSGKKAKVNGVSQTKMTEFVGHFQVVLFAPEDLQLVKGGPSVRRRFIDMELGQTQPKYLYHLSHYTRALAQRNTLLKNRDIDWSFIEVFDSQLIEHGMEVLRRRLHFMRDMRQFAGVIYESISEGREQFGMKYSSSLPGVKDVERMEIAEVEQLWQQALVNKRDSDRHFGYTTTGIHRDDIVMYLNDHPVQSFASQGQQRTIALALRLAEIDFMYKETGEFPVLLLDDVLSELDDMRQKNLVLSMSEKVQTIVTTTSLFQLNDRLTGSARLFHVHSGIIQSEGQV